MAVDHHGYIALPPSGAFQPAFTPVIAEVAERLNGAFPALIHSLYLYGSVAQGRAIPGSADLDMTLVFTQPPDPVTAEQLASVRAALEKAHPIISKIDFDCGLLQQVLHPDNSLSWGYWLKHHCRCISGEDLSQRFQPFRPSKQIAVAINGDFSEVINNWLREMKASDELKKRLLLQRAAARKAIRATAILRSEQDSDWPDTLQEHATKLTHRYPALADEMRYLLRVSTQPDGNLTEFSNRIRGFADWLSRECQTPPA